MDNKTVDKIIEANRKKAGKNPLKGKNKLARKMRRNQLKEYVRNKRIQENKGGADTVKNRNRR